MIVDSGMESPQALRPFIHQGFCNPCISSYVYFSTTIVFGVSHWLSRRPFSVPCFDVETEWYKNPNEVPLLDLWKTEKAAKPESSRNYVPKCQWLDSTARRPHQAKLCNSFSMQELRVCRRSQGSQRYLTWPYLCCTRPGGIYRYSEAAVKGPSSQTSSFHSAARSKFWCVHEQMTIDDSLLLSHALTPPASEPREPITISGRIIDEPTSKLGSLRMTVSAGNFCPTGFWHAEYTISTGTYILLPVLIFSCFFFFSAHFNFRRVQCECATPFWQITYHLWPWFCIKYMFGRAAWWEWCINDAG